MKRAFRFTALGVALSAMLSASVGWGQNPTFQRLTLPPTSFTNGRAVALSYNGTVAAGNGTKGNQRAIRWDAAGNPTELSGNNPISQSFVKTISADGSTIGGASQFIGGGGTSGIFGTLWDTNGVTVLGALVEAPGGVDDHDLRSQVNVVSLDGSVAAGYADNWDYVGKINNVDRNQYDGYKPAVWQGGGATIELRNLPGGSVRGEVLALTPAGDDFAGYASLTVDQFERGNRAVRWNGINGAAFPLGDLGVNSAGITNSYAMAVSNNGSIYAGEAEKYANNVFLGNRVVRWADDGTITELQGLGDDGDGFTNMTFTGMSSQGNIIVGTVNKYISQELEPGVTTSVLVGTRAVYWNLASTTPAQAIDLGTINDVSGSSAANGNSVDGSVVVGRSTSDRTGGDACIWVNGNPRQLYQLVTEDLGLKAQVDTARFVSFDTVLAVSGDGNAVAGVGTTRNADNTEISGTPFRVYFGGQLATLVDAPPTVQSTGVPIVSETMPLTFSTGQAVVLDFVATDPEMAAMSIQASGLPPGATLSAATVASGGTFTLEWTPTTTDVNQEYLVTIVVSDNATKFLDGQKGRVSFRLVSDGNTGGTTNAAPTLTGDVAQGEQITVGVGQTYAASFKATDPEGGFVTVTATGLPTSATLTPSAGARGRSPLSVALIWTPTPAEQGQTFTVSLTFADDLAAKVTRSFSLTAVDSTQTGTPPTLTGGPAQGASIQVGLGSRFTTSFVATDPEGNPVTVVASGLPPGATISGSGTAASGRSVTIAWSPTLAEVDSKFDVILTAVDDAGGTASRAFTLFVRPGNFASQRTNPAFITYYVGQAYLYSLYGYQTTPANGYYYYSYGASIYAYYYDVAAKDTNWTDPGNYASQLGVYKNYRYQQALYNYYGYYYGYTGLSFGYNDYAYYGMVFNYYAYSYALLDLIAD